MPVSYLRDVLVVIKFSTSLVDGDLFRHLASALVISQGSGSSGLFRFAGGGGQAVLIPLRALSTPQSSDVVGAIYLFFTLRTSI